MNYKHARLYNENEVQKGEISALTKRIEEMGSKAQELEEKNIDLVAKNKDLDKQIAAFKVYLNCDTF
jgi:hypothetical protein